jgi:uncharacterized linocin/CFP29 family protein
MERTMDYLNRKGSPLDDGLWARIDEAAVAAARAMLTGRRFLDVDGPYGAGLTNLEVGNDDFCRQPEADEAGAVLGRAVSVPMLRKSFNLSIRRVAGYTEHGQPLDLAPVEDAAEAVARREEEFVYYGQPTFNLFGLANSPDRLQHKGGDWSNQDTPVEDCIAAVSALDKKGFRGPYALAVAPELYNGLFRHYVGTELIQLRHLSRMFEKGIFKAPIEGAVAVDPRAGSIVVGQDLRAGFTASDGVHYQMYLSESMVLKLDEPGAVCSIAVAGAKGGRGKS